MATIKWQNWTLSIFFILLFAAPVYWFATGTGSSQYSNIEERNLVAFPTVSFQDMKSAAKFYLSGNVEKANSKFLNQFLNANFQRKVEKAVSDQFPLRYPILQIAKWNERASIQMAYLLLPDAAIPADMSSGVYRLRDNSQLMRSVKTFNGSVKKTINNRIANYETLIAEDPDIHFYLFFIERLEDAPYHPLNAYVTGADQGQGLAYFEKNMPPELILAKMQFADMEEYKDYNYNTDHHWNANGVLRGYAEIHQLLSKNFANISPPLTCELYTFPDFRFAGSSARRALLPNVSDDFTVPLCSLPAHTVLINGVESVYGKSEEYLSGKYATDTYQSHYSRYFGNNEALIEFDFDNDANRNLLIIGSSYKNPIIPLLAYHYSHTYTVDLRGYKDFSFTAFVRDHQIDDVLVIGQRSVILADDKTWMISP